MRVYPYKANRGVEAAPRLLLSAGRPVDEGEDKDVAVDEQRERRARGVLLPRVDHDDDQLGEDHLPTEQSGLCLVGCVEAGWVCGRHRRRSHHRRLPEKEPKAELPPPADHVPLLLQRGAGPYRGARVTTCMGRFWYTSLKNLSDA